MSRLAIEGFEIHAAPLGAQSGDQFFHGVGLAVGDGDAIADAVRATRAGLGTPREAIRLIRDGRELNGVWRVTRQTGIDLTRRMREYARRRVRELTKERLSGYILKKDSPTCGMEQVKVWDHRGTNEPNGRGIFAAELLRQFPTMPVEEEGRLRDPRIRENFIDRVFMYQQLRQL